MTETTNQIVLPLDPAARLAFPRLFRPGPPRKGEQDQSKWKYGCALILPPSFDPSAVIEVIKSVYAEKFGSPPKKSAKLCMQRVDEETDIRGAEVGGYMIRSSTKFRPPVVDQAKRPVFDEELFAVNESQAVERAESRVFAGCYVRAALEFWAYDEAGNRGVSCSPLALQLVRKGERLDRTFDVSATFDAIDGATDDLFDEDESEGDGTEGLFG